MLCQAHRTRRASALVADPEGARGRKETIFKKIVSGATEELAAVGQAESKVIGVVGHLGGLVEWKWKWKQRGRAVASCLFFLALLASKGDHTKSSDEAMNAKFKENKGWRKRGGKTSLLTATRKLSVTIGANGQQSAL